MKPLATHAAPVTPSRLGGGKREISKSFFHEMLHVFSSVPSGPSINLHFVDVDKQGHDNRTYRLGEHMPIRMPTAADYALKVPKEQELLLIKLLIKKEGYSKKKDQQPMNLQLRMFFGEQH